MKLIQWVFSIIVLASGIASAEVTQDPPGSLTIRVSWSIATTTGYTSMEIQEYSSPAPSSEFQSSDTITRPAFASGSITTTANYEGWHRYRIKFCDAQDNCETVDTMSVNVIEYQPGEPGTDPEPEPLPSPGVEQVAPGEKNLEVSWAYPTATQLHHIEIEEVSSPSLSSLFAETPVVKRYSASGSLMTTVQYAGRYQYEVRFCQDQGSGYFCPDSETQTMEIELSRSDIGMASGGYNPDPVPESEIYDYANMAPTIKYFYLSSAESRHTYTVNEEISASVKAKYVEVDSEGTQRKVDAERVEFYLGAIDAEASAKQLIASDDFAKSGTFKTTFSVDSPGEYYLLALAWDSEGASSASYRYFEIEDTISDAPENVSGGQQVDFSEYLSITGDFDEDGYTDLYFHGKQKIVLLHGDVVTPIVLDGPLGFAYFGKAGGGFGAALPWDMPDAQAKQCVQTGNCTDLTDDRVAGDINGDGFSDTLIKRSDGNATTVMISGAEGENLPNIIFQVLANGEVKSPGEARSGVPVFSGNLSDKRVSIGSGELVVDNKNYSLDYITSGGSVLGASVANDENIESAAVSFVAQPNLDGKEVATIDALTAFSGDFRVNEVGAATYKVPLKLPKGTAGVAPPIAFGYSSNNSLGSMGLGWQLSAGGAVSRCRQNLQIDARSLPIRFDGSDRFCLGGTRLLVQDGFEYGERGATYRPEVDNGLLVESVGGVDGHPDHFIVKAKDGSLKTYGRDRQSKRNGWTQSGEKLENRILSWHLSEFEDSVGNPITYHYAESPDHHRLEEIRYAYGGTSNGPAVVVKLHYDPKSESFPSWVSDARYFDNSLLKRVEVTNNGKPYRDYLVQYNQGVYESGSDTIDRVTTLKSCVGDYCMAPIKLKWGHIATRKFKPLPYGQLVSSRASKLQNTFPDHRSSEYEWARPSSSHYYNYTQADINGDGLPDMVITYSDEGVFRLAQSVQGEEGFSDERSVGMIQGDGNASPPGSEAPKIFPVDFNADGRQDLAVYSPSEQIWTGFISSPRKDGTWLLRNQKYVLPPGEELLLPANLPAGTRFADLNSDGLVDLFYSSETGDQVSVRYLERDPDKPSSSATAYGYLSGEEYLLDEQGFDTRNFAGVVDMNVDGKADIITTKVTLTPSSSPRYFSCSYDISIAVAQLEDGRADLETYPAVSGTFNHHYPWGVSSEQCENEYSHTKFIGPFYSDINNDGLGDLVWAFAELEGDAYTFNTVKYRLGKQGLTFGPSKIVTTEENLSGMRLLDVNTDRLPDIVVNLDNGEQKYIENQDGDFASETLKPLVEQGEAGMATQFSDINGDGLIDKVVTNTDGLKAYFGNPQSNDLLREIVTGQNVKTVVQYRPLSRYYAYSKLDGVKEVSAPRDEQPCEYQKFYDDEGNETYGICIEKKPATVADASTFYQAINDPFSDVDSNEQTGAHHLVPAQEYINSMPVVTVVGSSAPHGSDRDALAIVTYEYEDLRIQAGGRGLLGFKKLSTIDQQTGVRTTTEYRQDWPFIGMPVKTTTEAANGQKLSESITEPAIRSFANLDDGALEEKRHSVKQYGTSALGTLVVFEEAVTDIEYDPPMEALVPGKDDAEPLTTEKLNETVTLKEVDGWGNVTRLEVQKWGRKLSIGDQGGWRELQKRVTENQYFSIYEGIHKGRLKESKVTTSRENEQVVRTASFTYYGFPGSQCTSNVALKGMLCSEKITLADYNPEYTKLPHTTIHFYDEFGNKTFTRTGSRVSKYKDYDERGRYVESVYDVFSPSSGERDNAPNSNYSGANGGIAVKVKEVISRNEQEVPLLTRHYVGDASHRTQIKASTPLGKVYFESDNTGQHTRTRYLYLADKQSNFCPSYTLYAKETETGQGPTTGQCINRIGRIIGTYKIGFDDEHYVRTRTKYDMLGNPIAVSEPLLGEGYFEFVYTKTTYDILGRPTKVTHPFDITDEEGESAGIGRATTVYTYSGYTESTVTSGVEGKPDRRKDRTENALGELVQIIEQGQRTIRYSYDVLGNLEKTVDPKGNETIILHNSLGKKYQMDDPDKGVWQYRYNSYGELEKIVDANGQVKRIEYDFKGRKTAERHYSKGPGSELILSKKWHYDTARNGLGQISKEENALEEFVRQYTYDSSGRESVTKTTMASVGKQTESFYEKKTYNEHGRLFQVFDAARVGPQFNYNGIEYEYTRSGYLKELKDAGSGEPFYTISGVDGRDNVSAITHGDGTEVRYYYDKETGYLGEIQRSRQGSEEVELYRATWDHLGNMTERVDDFLGDTPETFRYDQYNRLIRSTLNGQTVSIEYDDIGNIERRSDVNDNQQWEYHDTKAHAVKQVGARVLEYDSNGNVVRDGDKTIRYNAADKVVELVKPTNTIIPDTHETIFSYGSDDRRFKRVDRSSEGVTTTLYIGNVEKVYNADGSIEWKRIVGGRVQVIHKEGESGRLNAGRRYYFYRDHLDSIVAITEADGALVKRMAYDPWGRRREVSNGAWQPENLSYDSVLAQFSKTEQPITNRGFTGHEMLDEVGIIHMNGRIYDATLGRFLQADPFVQAPDSVASLNRYAYVMNNPLNAVDPTGYFLDELWKEEIRPYAGIMVSAALVVATNGSASFFIQEFWGAVALGSISGGVNAAVNGGNPVEGALIGGVSGAAFFSVGSMFKEGNVFAGLEGASAVVHKTVLHGMTGGVLAELQGGNFGHGFIKSGLAKASSLSALEAGWGDGGQFIAAIIAGGTASHMTGGKFANGAQTAAIAFLVNQMKSGAQEGQSRGCSGQMCRQQLYEQDSKLFQSADLSVDGQLCAGPCIGGELELSKDHGASTTIKSGFGLKASGGGGSDINIINLGETPKNSDLSTINYLSGQLGPAGITINHYAWPEGSQWSFELNLRFPGGLGVNGGTGLKKW